MTSFRILIVDDQRDVRRLFADGLQMLGPGMDILELPSGEEAMLVAFRKTVHLVITDIKLPGISGFDLVKRIRKNNPDLKTILMTNLTDPKIQEQVAQIGADAFFFEPVGIGELLDAAKKCLGIGEPAAEAESEEEQREQPAPLADETQPTALKTVEIEPPEILMALSTLREQLKAKTVAFIDTQGKVLAEVGEVDLITDPTLVTRLLATLKNSLEVSNSLSQGFQSSLLCFSGAENYLCMAPVGTLRALLVVGGQAFQASLLSPGRRITSTAAELQKLIDRIKEAGSAEAPALAQPAEPAALEEVVEEANPEDLAAVEALFSQTAEKDLKKVDLDAFWSSLAENSDPSEGKENGFLSYEEARKLGLTPE
jgi:DNA-binding response OmpR family regulator